MLNIDKKFKNDGVVLVKKIWKKSTIHPVIKEYNNILQNGVSKEEIKRAQAQIRATVAFSRDGTYAVASALNEAIAIGDWTFYTNFMDNINKVKEEKIKKVIKKYFTEDQSTTGWFIAREPKN